MKTNLLISEIYRVLMISETMEKEKECLDYLICGLEDVTQKLKKEKEKL